MDLGINTYSCVYGMRNYQQGKGKWIIFQTREADTAISLSVAPCY